MRRTVFPILGFLLVMSTTALAEANDHVPTIDELIQLQSVSGTAISPDGKWIAYRISQADFEEDAYISQLWLTELATGETLQLTRGKKSVGGFEWSPDSNRIAFTRSVEGKNQLVAIQPDGGEAVQLTKSESGVGGFEWSPDGKSIAYTAGDAKTDAEEARDETYGAFEVVRRDYRYRHLWILEVKDALTAPTTGNQHTSGAQMSVTGFSWSPDSKAIAFAAAKDPDLVSRESSDIYVLNPVDDSIRKLVDQPGPDSNPIWSPDGRTILFSTVMGKKNYFPLNSELATIPAGGGNIRVLTGDFDENARVIGWKERGIYFTASQKTTSHLFLLNPGTLEIDRVSDGDSSMWGSFSLDHTASRAAFLGSTRTSLGELYVSDLPRFEARALTNMTDQVDNWVLGTREVISWPSKDGTEIEGVLIKPSDFDPTRQYPLLCVIHGGPTGIDRPGLLVRGTRYYPVDLWAARGALILRVNYRGSAGYGEKFRTLNVRNLGVGDAWDVLSGVEHLVKRGWVDPSRVGSMGWSQGGYISAFLTTSSDQFAAISVGAGISNWATYYYNTDITPFTRHYLEADPVEDPDIYAKTSPMTYIKQARTPTLIQHGEFDRRVPIPNAYELRQGLEDRGVPVEMIVYKGYGHGISKPRSMRAVMLHNLSWFNHYLWGDPLPDLTKPPIEKKDK